MTETMFEPEEENEQYIRYYEVSNGMRDTAFVVFARFAEHKDPTVLELYPWDE